MIDSAQDVLSLQSLGTINLEKYIRSEFQVLPPGIILRTQRKATANTSTSHIEDANSKYFYVTC